MAINESKNFVRRRIFPTVGPFLHSLCARVWRLAAMRSRLKLLLQTVAARGNPRSTARKWRVEKGMRAPGEDGQGGAEGGGLRRGLRDSCAAKGRLGYSVGG